MRYHLRNQRDPERELVLTAPAWFTLLDLAEEYGWKSLARLDRQSWNDEPFFLQSALFEPEQEKDWESAPWQVPIEDALNLADALEQAFIEWEPPVTDRLTGLLLQGGTNGQGLEAGIGTLIELLGFCREGAFWIEMH